MKNQGAEPTDSQLSRRAAARGALSELAKRYRRFKPRAASKKKGDDTPADVGHHWAMGKVKANLLQTLNANGHL
jgi:hypothetical protein